VALAPIANQLKDRGDRARDHAALFGRCLVATDGVGFARACLTVGEHGGVVAVEDAGDQALHTRLVQLGLADLGWDHVVKGELLVFADHDLVRFGRHFDAGLVLVDFFAVAQWAHLFKGRGKNV